MKVGLEVLQQNPNIAKDWGRCGLLSNQASVTRDYVHAWQVCKSVLGNRLVSLFGPQHGFAGTAQDNMIETSHGRHLATGLPVYSLYADKREPTEEMVRDLDTIVIDLQIVGCRVYTFKYTIAACLRAAKKFGKRVVILDRHNPVGGVYVEGNVLDLRAKSFVGEFPIPMRHGLTAAEAARFFNTEIKAQLDVVKLEGWDPTKQAHEYDRPWVLTSPNLPTLDPVFVYNGIVMFEGLTASEGRGTGLPFQFVGAPYIKDSAQLIERVKALSHGAAGVHMREACFEPTSQKWQGKVCQGLQFHIVDPDKIASFYLGLATVRAFIELGGSEFAWRQPPYEYDFSTLPIKLIIGDLKADERLEAKNFSVRDACWQTGVDAYIANAQPALLYPRKMKLLVP